MQLGTQHAYLSFTYLNGHQPGVGGSIAQSQVSFLVPQSLDTFSQSPDRIPTWSQRQLTLRNSGPWSWEWGWEGSDPPLPEELGHKGGQ